MHCQPASATLLFVTWYVPLLQVQFRSGSHVVLGGQVHCVGKLAPVNEYVLFGHGTVLLTSLPGQYELEGQEGQLIMVV